MFNRVWRGAFLFATILAVFASQSVLNKASAQTQGWPTVNTDSSAREVLSAFQRGPYGQMAKGRSARQTLVEGTYALVDPAGKFAPIFTDRQISRMKNGSGGWLDVATGNA